MAASASLVVSVGAPQRIGEGRSGYVSYKIESRATGLDGWGAEASVVIRRYSDFDWLRERLVELHPAVIVPPLPDKTVMSRFEVHFIEARNRGLQRFVDRVSAHPVLRVTNEVRQFLTLDDADFAHVRDTTRRGTTAHLRDGFSSFFSSASTAMSGAVDRARGTSDSREGTKTAEDLSFEELEVYVEAIREAVKVATSSVEELQRGRLAVAMSLAQFGSAMQYLGAFEGDDLGASLQAIAEAGRRQAQMEKMQAEGGARWLVQDWRDAKRVTKAAQDALRHRDAVSDIVRQARHLLETRRLQAQEHSAGPQRAAADQAVAAATEALEDAVKDAQAVNNQVLEEVRHWREQRLEDFRAMMLEYAVLEATRAEATENLWRSALEPTHTAAEREEARSKEWLASGGNTASALAEMMRQAETAGIAPATPTGGMPGSGDAGAASASASASGGMDGVGSGGGAAGGGAAGGGAAPAED